MVNSNSRTFYICSTCAHHNFYNEDVRSHGKCERCGEAHKAFKPKSARLTVALTLTSLILYIPANILPFMTIELYGNRTSSNIWEGVVSLAENGSWAIAGIVFLASMVIPFLKLLILLYLSFTAKNYKHSRFKTRLYHIVESIGRWSMLDIFLLAVLVAMMKLGSWTSVEPEMGAIMFALVVIFTMFASAYFDPQLLWKAEDGKDSEQ